MSSSDKTEKPMSVARVSEYKCDCQREELNDNEPGTGMTPSIIHEAAVRLDLARLLESFLTQIHLVRLFLRISFTDNDGDNDNGDGEQQ